MEEKKNQGHISNNDYDPTKHEYYDADTHNVAEFPRYAKIIANILLLGIIIIFAVAVWYNWQEIANFFL